MSRPARLLRGAASIAALLFVAPMCSDLITGPNGSEGATVTVQYVSPMVGLDANNKKVVELRPGDPITPVVSIVVGDEPQPRARFAFKSIAAKPIVSISASATDLKVDSLIGVDTLTVSLVGTTIDSTTANRAQDTVIVVALPTRITVTGGTTLTAIGATAQVKASLEDNATPTPNLLKGRVWFKSTDPSVLSVDSAGTYVTTGADAGKYTTTMTAVANSGATPPQILTIVEGRDTTRTNVPVQQTLFAYALSSNAGPLPSIGSKGDSVRILAQQRDSLGHPLVPQTQFQFVADKPAKLAVGAVTGWAVALEGPDTIKVRIAGRDSTQFPNEFIRVIVQQIAAQISSPRVTGGTISLNALNVDTTINATATDRLGNLISLDAGQFTYTSSNPAVATVDGTGTIHSVDVGSTTIRVVRDTASLSFGVTVTNIPKTITITPDPMTIRSINETVNATADVRNRAVPPGPVPGAVVNWSSLDPTIASVNASGQVTGLAVGTARIVGATAVGGALDTITVNVSNQAASIVLGLASATMASINDTLVVPITAMNGLGATLPATGVRWRSDASDIVKVTIANDGTIVALKRGEARIIAENADGSVADTVAVTVTNAPASVVLNRTSDNLAAFNQALQYTATITNARGGVIPQGSSVDQNQITWRSTDNTVATLVTNGDGSATATAIGNGTTLIIGETGSGTFASGLRADTATLTVNNSAVAVAVNPNSVSITSVGNTQQLTASATNSVGGPVTGLTFTWNTSDPLVATVSSSGLVTATGTGTATITATSGALQGTSTITVTNLPTFIDITLADITLASVNDVTTLAATLKNAAGATLPSTAATWTSDDPLIALVTSDGTVTAKAPGTTKIRATNPSNAAIKDSITVTVSNAAATVTLTPGTTQTLTSIGQTLNISTTVLNQAGQPIVNPAVTWDVVAGTSVSVATSGVGTGLVTALTNGTSTVRATSGSVSATVDIIVAQAISPSQSTVSAAASTLTANGIATTTITVQLRDANGNNYVRTPAATVVMTPSSGIPLTVTDNGNGNFTATHPASTTAGASTVSVTANGTSLSNTAIITFTPGNESHYAVTVSNATPVAGTPITVSAQLKDANGNNVATAGKTVTWTSSNGGSFSGGGTSSTGLTGLATITFTTANQTTTHSVTATDNTAITGTSGAIATTAGAANKYIVTAGASSVAAGSSTTITAQLTDANGNPVGLAGQSVTWSGGAGGSFGTNPAVTSALGVATTTFTPNTAAGSVVTVTGTDGSARTGTSGNITTVAGAAAKLTLTNAPDLNPLSGAPFTVQPIVRLQDGSASSNNVSLANIAVTAVISSGTGTLGGITTVLTDGSGVATFGNLSISGPVGANTISFTSSGLAPAVHNVTIASGAAQNIIANSVTSQSVTAGDNAVAPSVIVRDASNNPKGGVAVTFTVTRGGGTTDPASGSTVTSLADGTATLNTWTTGATAGINTVSASVAGLAGSPIVFTATTVAGTTTAAQSTVVRTGANNIVADGIASSTIVVTAKDANGNPVAGKTISLDDAGASSTISPANGTSDANGQVTFTVTNTVGETATYTATVTDGGAVVVTQTAQVTFRAGNNYLVTASSATPAAGSNITITAQLRDASNVNVPQSGKTVVWSKLCNAGACALGATGGSFATPTSLTDATGKATVTLTVSTDASIDMTVTATDNDALTGTSGAINVGPAAATVVRVETAADGTGAVIGAQNVTAGSSVTGFAITRDVNGNFIANVAADSWALINTTGGVISGDLVVAGDNKSATFTGALVGTAQIEATSAALAKTPSGILTVIPGAATDVRVETAADGTGAVVGAQNVTSGAAITVFSITRDAAGNFVANVAADAWALINATGGVANGDLVAAGDNKSATFTGNLVGTAQIQATSGALTTTPSGVLTVVPGAAASVNVETAADGTGAVVGAQAVTSGNSIVVFSITRDAAGNFIANVAADAWSLIAVTGGVVQGDLVAAGDSKSATFTAAASGSAQIQATSGALATTPSGVITVP